MLFDFAHSVDKWLRRPWRSPIPGGHQQVTLQYTYSCCTLYDYVTAVYLPTTILTSDCLVFSDSCCFLIYKQFLTVGLGSYFWCLQLQHRGGLSGVCVAVDSQRVAYQMKLPSLFSILFHSHLAVVVVEPWFAAVEVNRWWWWNEEESPEEEDNETTGKSWGLYT